MMLAMDIVLSVLCLFLAIALILESFWNHRLRRDLAKAFAILDELLYGSTEHEDSRDK